MSLCNRVVLYVPLLSDEFVLYCDASGCGLGACLQVLRDGVELPVAFYSKQLRGAEKRYTVTELETLAIATVEHFNVYVERASVKVYTDNRACEALRRSRSSLNPRLRRWADKLQS